PRPAKLMIAVDQAERLFVEGEPERVEAFASLLRALVEAGLANLIVVLRSDTYGRFQAVEPFLALLDGHGATLDLLPPTQAELEEIVTRPVAACHPPLAYETSVSGRSLAAVMRSRSCRSRCSAFTRPKSCAAMASCSMRTIQAWAPQWRRPRRTPWLSSVSVRSRRSLR